jgi:diketogulonate reductase-like aldo/keto reductase
MAKYVVKEVGALGVCNFSARQLTQLLDFCLNNNLPRPAVVQNEFHPLLLAREVRALCKREGIVSQAYARIKDMEELDSLDKSKEGQNTMAGWLREQDPDYY